MTKPRARFDARDGDDDATRALQPVRPPPRRHHDPPRAAPTRDGVVGAELCKLFLRGGASCCALGDACARAHVPRRERAPCWTFERYGVCARDVARRKDPDAPECWFPHPPSRAVAIGDGDRCLLAFQCEIGMAARTTTRCRELFGDDAVVASARADLTRNADCVVLARCGGGVAGALRRVAREPHFLVAQKRIYVVGGDGGGGGGGDARLATRSTTVAADSDDELRAALRAMARGFVTDAARAFRERRGEDGEGGEGGDDGGRAMIRPRGFPPTAGDAFVAALTRPDDDADDDADAREPCVAAAKDATHGVDVVVVAGRAYVSMWSATAPCEAEAGDDADFASAASTRDDDAPGPPSPPPPGVATLRDLIYHCESIKTRREREAPPCRAFYKLQEACLRARVTVERDWRCVDVGASPGGWTHYIARRLDAERGGVVYAIDPGAIAIDGAGASLPACVTHLAMRAEDASDAVDDDLRRRFGSVGRGDGSGDGSAGANIRLLVCDANAPPRDVVEILLSLTGKLATDEKGATLVTTFKNFCRGYGEWERQIEEAVASLEARGFRDPRLFHLFSNCAQEKTLVMRYPRAGVST